MLTSFCDRLNKTADISLFDTSLISINIDWRTLSVTFSRIISISDGGWGDGRKKGSPLYVWNRRGCLAHVLDVTKICLSLYKAQKDAHMPFSRPWFPHSRDWDKLDTELLCQREAKKREPGIKIGNLKFDVVSLRDMRGWGSAVEFFALKWQSISTPISSHLCGQMEFLRVESFKPAKSKLSR